MFADMIYAYHGPIQKNIRWPYTTNCNNVKRYKFSCLAGCYLRHHRLNFITDLFYRNLVDDTFYLSGIPIMYEVKSGVPMHNSPTPYQPKAGVYRDEEYLNFHLDTQFRNTHHGLTTTWNKGELDENILNWIKTSKDFSEDMNFTCWDVKLLEYFKENAESIFKGITFFNETSVSKSRYINDRPRMYYSHIKKDFRTKQFTRSKNYHWDKIIPDQLLESHINIPLETYFGIHVFYTEKTFKPIFAGIPFISSFSHDINKSSKKR